LRGLLGRQEFASSLVLGFNSSKAHMKQKITIAFSLFALALFFAPSAQGAVAFGDLTYSTTTPATVNNVGETFSYASGTISSIYFYTQGTSGTFQLRACGDSITDPAFGFGRDMYLDGVPCTTAVSWNAVSSTAVGSVGLRRFDVIDSTIATSTYTLYPGKVYVLLRNGGNEQMYCQEVSNPAGVMVSEGSPNSTDNFGVCNDFPYLLFNANGGLEVSIEQSKPPVINPDDCTYSGSFFGFKWPTGDDALCFLNSWVSSAGDGIESGFDTALDTALGAATVVFPANLYYHFNDLISQIDISGTVPALTFSLPTGQNIVLMSSSTMAEASDAANFDFRDFAAKVAYGLTGIFVIGLAYFMIL